MYSGFCAAPLDRVRDRVAGKRAGAAPGPGPTAASGHQRVDLVDRRRGPLDDAHRQHLLERLGGLVAAHEYSAGAAVVGGEGVRVARDRQVRGGGEVQGGEAVVEGEAPRLVPGGGLAGTRVAVAPRAGAVKK